MPMSMMGIALPWVGGAMILAELETDSLTRLRISSASRHRGLWIEGMKGEEECEIVLGYYVDTKRTHGQPMVLKRTRAHL